MFAVIDASGGPGTTGLFDGNVHAIGSFDECVAIEVVDQEVCGFKVPDFRGRYVLATLMPVAAATKSNTNNHISARIGFVFQLISPVSLEFPFFDEYTTGDWASPIP